VKHILLTGGNGFVGKVLQGMLLEAGWRLTSACGPAPGSDEPAAGCITLDVRDADAVALAVKQAQPSHVIHLAAISHIPSSFSNPRLTWQTNVIGSLNLLEAIKQHAPTAFVLFVSSAEVYGDTFKSGLSVAEHCACLPVNPYAASKLAAEVVITQYFRQGIRGAIARPFNHIGRGQSPDFVTASFARQIALIEAGLQSPAIQVGNLDSFRDFLDVRDVCRAYLNLLELSCPPWQSATFNIASGKARSIQEILNQLLEQSHASIHVTQEPLRMRPSDIPYALGNAEHIRHTVGWTAQIPLEDSLSDLLGYWRQQISSQ
jgi:GDP-4-dehydro-6-deoxy-D-mannose reductase